MPKDDAPRLRQTHQRLKGFLRLERELKKYVDDAWQSVGLDVVRAVREHYSASELPIAIHTQRGLVLLRDELITELNELDVGWLLKNRFSAATDRLIIGNVIKRAKHFVRSGRQRVFVIDDNPEFLNSFEARHGEVYDIVSTTDQGEVLPILDRLQRKDAWPDILLVDLYYPRSTSPTHLPVIDLANTKLAEFGEFERDLQPLVRESFTPVGVSLVKAIRGMHSADVLPIIIYTQGSGCGRDGVAGLCGSSTAVPGSALSGGWSGRGCGLSVDGVVQAVPAAVPGPLLG